MTVKPVLWMVAVAGLLASPPAGATDKVSIIMSWVAEAEHGGFYQALATGIYAKHGLDVTIRQGGPQLNTGQMLAAGAIERPVDEGEAGPGLSLEIVRDRFSIQISERRLPGEPDDLATLGDDGRRESARFLKICTFQMYYNAVWCHWLNPVSVVVLRIPTLKWLNNQEFASASLVKPPARLMADLLVFSRPCPRVIMPPERGIVPRGR